MSNATSPNIGTTAGRAAGAHPGIMRAQRYRPYEGVRLPDRRWPGQRIERAPRWCSVDLRDGNQALIEPMGAERKRRMFEGLVEIGFREIEVGFPSASQPDLDFVRELIEGGSIPQDVTIQVLTQAREELIRASMESIRGARRAIVHLYNSTSTLQRRVVFERDRAGVTELAVRGARLIRRLAQGMPETDVVLEYSPESFTGTELEYALEICEAVIDVWQPSASEPVIVNLPATVEMSTPNIYADRIEWFSRRLPQRDRVVLSVHPHNDRGTAVAAAELALLAGAERVEGTLFGNGERTGNVDLVTLALNLFTQGVDPELDLRDVDSLVGLAESCNRMPVHPRHPYAGELVFTAFSGSHQDAIKKGLAALETSAEATWEVPYLPIDPADVGRDYEALIRINSQSGKGGVAFLLERDHGLRPPRRMQIALQRRVQALAERSGGEVSSEAIGRVFESEYLVVPGPFVLFDHEIHSSGGECRLRAEIAYRGVRERIEGRGNGPIDAFFGALTRRYGLRVGLRDYREHSLGQGADAVAMAYVELADAASSGGSGRASHFGAGKHASIVRASLEALISALNRAQADRRGPGRGSFGP